MSATLTIKYRNVVYTVNDVVKLTGLPYSTVVYRIRAKWTGYEVFNTPYKHTGVRPYE